MGNPRRDIKPEPYGPEAKEFLRQRLIGKAVKVSIDYTRQVQVITSDGADPANRGMDFGSITLLDEKPTEAGQVRLFQHAQVTLPRAQQRRDELSPRWANCAPATYVGRVLSSAREPSSQHTVTGVGLAG